MAFILFHIVCQRLQQPMHYIICIVFSKRQEPYFNLMLLHCHVLVQNSIFSFTYWGRCHKALLTECLALAYLPLTSQITVLTALWRKQEHGSKNTLCWGHSLIERLRAKCLHLLQELLIFIVTWSPPLKFKYCALFLARDIKCAIHGLCVTLLS